MSDLSELERQQRRAYWKAEEEANSRLPQFQPQDPLSGVALQETYRIEAEAAEARRMREEKLWKEKLEAAGMGMADLIGPGGAAAAKIEEAQLEEGIDRLDRRRTEMGVSETTPDVWPEPLTMEEEQRLDAFIKREGLQGKPWPQVQAAIKARLKETGGNPHITVLQAGTPILKDSDLDPRDPARSSRKLDAAMYGKPEEWEQMKHAPVKPRERTDD